MFDAYNNTGSPFRMKEGRGFSVLFSNCLYAVSDGALGCKDSVNVYLPDVRPRFSAVGPIALNLQGSNILIELNVENRISTQSFLPFLKTISSD